MASAVWNGPLAGGVPAHQFPAGVSPQACPNFPNCANPAVAAQPNSPAPNQWNAAPQPWNGGQQSWNGGQQGQWNAGAYNPAPVPQYNNGQAGLSPLDRGEYTGDGDYRGEGLAESGAYGPHCKMFLHKDYILSSSYQIFNFTILRMVNMLSDCFYVSYHTV